MTELAPDSPSRNSSDRRFLPRADGGRRDNDDLIFGGKNGERDQVNTEQAAAPLVHLVCLIGFVVLGFGAIWKGNNFLAPLLFDKEKINEVASILQDGNNYATYDLNINSRVLRNAHIAKLERTPDVIVLGASHWQEGNAELLPQFDFYNAHVHRDYYEDMLAVVEMLVRNNRLPEKMIITIRDNLFTPVDKRTDFLWQEYTEMYYAMADRLGLAAHPFVDTLPLTQLRASISLTGMHANLIRYVNAPVLPHATSAKKHASLDLLIPDGSIIWSESHDELFSQQRARETALEFAESRRHDPPVIDQNGVANLDALLAFLIGRGTEVTLAHPPFNPIFYDALSGSAYMEGLQRIEALTRNLAEKYRLKVVGGFDPRKVGCNALQYIDAEHSNPSCLKNILQEFAALYGR